MSGLGLKEIREILHDAGVPRAKCDQYASKLYTSPHRHLWDEKGLADYIKSEVEGARMWGGTGRVLPTISTRNGLTFNTMNQGIEDLAREGLLPSHETALTAAKIDVHSVRKANRAVYSAHETLLGKTVAIAEAESGGFLAKLRASGVEQDIAACTGRLEDAVVRVNHLTKGKVITLDKAAVVGGIKDIVGGHEVPFLKRLIASSKGIDAMRHGEPFALSHISFGKAIGWTALAALIGAGASNALGNDATDSQRR